MGCKCDPPPRGAPWKHEYSRQNGSQNYNLQHFAYHCVAK